MLRLQGINAVIAVLVAFVVLHLVFVPEQHSIRTTFSTLLGGTSFLLMTWSVVLATRLEIFEEMFGGLDRMYQVHRVAGTFTAVFALVHFFSIPKELPAGVDPVLNSTFPSAQIGMAAMVLLVIGLFVALNRKISYSRWRNPHKVMAFVYILVIGHFMNAPGIFFEQFSAAGILLIVAGLIGMIALVYTMFGMNKRTAKHFTIEAVNSLERATEVVLKPVGDMLKFKPGQFAFVEIQGKDWSEPHPFTIASAPDEDRLRFTMKVLGDWTRKVREELQPGGEVVVRGPYGRFDASKTSSKRQVWIAGGIGLTPFLSKLRAMDEEDNREVHFAYAARNKEEAIFIEELEAIATDRHNITIYPLFSDEGDFARIDVAKQKLPDPLTDYEYFICGPKPMVEGLMKDLKKEGVKRKAIHVEAFEFR
ncbi:ferric reductase-like transmembrane domain-containing protein [Anderseniella sp. Alg231-50]|uniref:ferric reductase-like transmembrane domain-containing protein n=1 Tax=Anderseniella sp. Alg231-50 TaxID=1922226 RepID=UPI000D54CBCC